MMPKLMTLAARRCSARLRHRAHAENFLRGARVDVLAGAKGFDEHGVLGEMRQDAQLDLRVVGGEQRPAGLGDERGANLAAELGAHGDVLQVGVGGAEAAGGGAGLAEARVQAAGGGLDQFAAARPRRWISAWRVRGTRSPCAAVRAAAPSSASTSAAVERALARLRLAGGCEIQLVEEDFGELLRRIDVELARRASSQMRFSSARISRFHGVGHGGERGGIDADAVPFHRGEDGRERQIDFFVNAGEFLRVHFLAQSGARRCSWSACSPAAPESVSLAWRRTTRGKVVLRCGGAQQIGVEHGGVADVVDRAGEQLGEFRVVDDFGALRGRRGIRASAASISPWSSRQAERATPGCGESSKAATRAPKPSVSRSPASSVSQTAMGWSRGCAFRNARTRGGRIERGIVGGDGRDRGGGGQIAQERGEAQLGVEVAQRGVIGFARARAASRSSSTGASAAMVASCFESTTCSLLLSRASR